MSTALSADRIEQVAFGFMASKVLFSAIEFGLFTELAKGPVDAAEIQRRLSLHSRSARDFLDVLVALGMLERQGKIYCNTGTADYP
jgi:predicted DNA-binding transcriptional regulator